MINHYETIYNKIRFLHKIDEFIFIQLFEIKITSNIDQIFYYLRYFLIQPRYYTKNIFK